MKQRKVLSLAGGGGSSLTAKSSLTDSQPPQLRNRLDRRCHPELDSGSIRRDRKKVTLVRFRLGGRNDRIGITRAAFTMAEILLSLTIIGVVAAITLPSLTGNINERTWNTQRKALYARFSQAISLMPSVNGYGTLTGTLSADGTQTVTEDTATETFLTEGFSKVLKINNICDSEHLADCGIPSKVTTLNGSLAFSAFPRTLGTFNSYFNGSFVGGTTGSEVFAYHQLDTKATAFETQNGESIVTYYNPNCAPDMNEIYEYKVQPKVCANFVYDLNGNKGPNTVGKDIGFITVIYPTDSVVVAPMPIAQMSDTKASQKDAGKLCASLDSESRVPNKEEMIAIFTNQNLIGQYKTSSGGGKGNLWSGSLISPTMGWQLSEPTGLLYNTPRTVSLFVKCVKR